MEARPREMFIGEKRLDRYLEEAGTGWVVRLGNEINALDLSSLIEGYSSQGRRAFHPRLMLALIIYGMLLKQWSLRELEALAKRDVGAWWLCGGHQPDHSTLAKFLARHASVLTDEFFAKQMAGVMARLKLKSGITAVDGTVTEAAASRFSLMRKEALAILAAEKAEAAKLAANDSRIVAEAARLEEAHRKAEERTARIERHGKSTEYFRLSPLEPEAVVQPRKDGAIRPAYKPSILAHEKGFIVGVTVEPSSEGAALPALLAQHSAIFGAKPQALLADAGYFSFDVLKLTVERDIDFLCPPGRTLDGGFEKKNSTGLFPRHLFIYDEGTNTYRCPAGQNLSPRSKSVDTATGREVKRFWTPACLTCPSRPRCTRGRYRYVRRYEDEHLKEAMRQVFTFPAARRLHRRRAAIVEPRFAQLQQRQGLTRFHRRGLAGARLEMTLHCLAFNLRLAGQLMTIVLVIGPSPQHTSRSSIAAVFVSWMPANT